MLSLAPQALTSRHTNLLLSALNSRCAFGPSGRDPRHSSRHTNPPPRTRPINAPLQAPLETRLKNEVKIGKWDQMSTYGLIEHSEKIHRKLNKFIREYQGDVLEYPVGAPI